jgi:CheY-like chemotaxis protein
MSSPKHFVVLLVDDEPLIRLLAADSLQDAGFDVAEAGSADEALAVLRSRSDVGLLFTDINMPGELDGLELAELVHRSWPVVKLLVTSGKGLRAPLPDDGRFLCKPYSMRAMTDLVISMSASGEC